VLVVVGRGSRRNPRAEADGFIIIDGNALSRQALANSIAIAAGKASPELAALSGKRRSLSAATPIRVEAIARKKSILVVEDNEINQIVIRQQLELLGYAADVAPSGRDALKRLKGGDYALLLTDLHMPEMDGYDLTLAIRLAESGSARLPIVALTANALKGEAERCRAVGMDDYLCKPAALTELAALLERWLPVQSPDSAPVSPEVAPVDVSVLESLVGGDKRLVDEVLREFSDLAVVLGRELIDCCSALRATQAAEIAHKLKSSARSVGALKLGNLCEVIESAGLSADVAACSRLRPVFQAELASVIAFLRGQQQQGVVDRQSA
jgi:two-component system sensor histidine kinase/response regulator